MSGLELGNKTATATLRFDLNEGWSCESFPDLDSEQTLVVVFASHEFCDNFGPLDELRLAFPQSKIIGCSTPACCCDGDLIDASIAVGIIRFASTEIRVSSAPLPSAEESLAAGRTLGDELKAPNLKGILIFSDGVTTDGTELIRGLQEDLPPDVTIAGGLASGHSLDDTWVLCGGKLKRSHACAVGFIGESVELVRATGGGWRQIGSECVATRTSGKTLFELDGEPAYEVYKRQVGTEAGYGLHESSFRCPLTLRMPGLEMQIVRDINTVDEATGAIELAGDIPEGVIVQVMTTNEDEILDGVDEAIERMRSKTIMPEKNALAICVSCAGRRTVLLEKTKNEAALVREGLGDGIHQIGMFAFGEISTTSSGPPQVHNETITMGSFASIDAGSMSEQPSSQGDSSNALNRTLKRLLRRQGVSFEQTPSLENWNNFLRAADQTISEFAHNRTQLEQSVRSTPQKLNQAYEDLKVETSLRLEQAESHKRELEGQVQERTADLEEARQHLERVNKRLEYDATHDHLTGAHNRSYFIRELNRRVALQGTTGASEFSLFFIDFDRFKYINDSFGHLVGDKVLIQVANRLAKLADHATCVARLGGDEFVLLTARHDEDVAIQLAQRISDTFTSPVRVGDNEIIIFASIGIVLSDGTYQSADNVVRDADIAMYRAKDLRWIHPTKGVISPGKFIPLAEELQMVMAIDRIVFEKTCQQYRDWRANEVASAQQKFNVNLSSAQLAKSDIVSFLLSTADAYDVNPHEVVLEITESYLLEDSALVMKNLNEMNELGFDIYVDDFGTGYSSLSYLAKYPIHGIKIDRSFVRDLADHPENRELIRSIIAMADALNLKVITEGVETMEQLRVITELGCHYIQGFLFTRPMNSQQATDFLLEQPYLDLLECNESLQELTPTSDSTGGRLTALR